MKYTSLILASALAGSLVSGCETTNFQENEQQAVQETKQELELDNFFGTYRGFGPAEVSPTKMGELELTINKDFVTIRMATGHKIHSEEFPTTRLTLMTSEEIARFWLEGSPYVERSVGFKDGKTQYLFTPDAKENEFGLIIGHPLASLLGQILLYSPTQIKRGDYQKTLDRFEKEKVFFPRLQYDGKMAPK